MTQPPLKVLHLRQSSNIWGPEKGILSLCRCLPLHGFTCEIAVVYRRSGNEPSEHPLVAAARVQGIPATQVDGHLGAQPACIRWLRHKLENEQFSILHSHEYKTDLVAALAAGLFRRRRPSLIATVRHTEPGLQMGLFQALDSLALHRFDRLTVPSEGALAELRRWPVLGRRATVVHHSVDASNVLGNGIEPSGPLPPRSSGAVISIVGRLQMVKGHRIFLRSAQMVVAKRPDTRFWIIGDGELREELEALACSLGIAHAVSFLGYRNDACEAMTRSDVIVSSSFYEAFPRALLEALALERPVVASAVGGIPEIVLDGETGLLTPAGNPSALAAAVLRLLDDPYLARRLAASGRRFVAQRYTPEAQASALANLYREALACR